MGSILIALCSSISIRLPFTPVPLAIAPHVCLALGAILGRNRGALAVLAYLFQGAMGFPVFALGASGLLHLLGPRGGYLIGYAAAAYVTGFLIERMREKTAYKTFMALAAGNGIIYLLGVSQLSLFIGFKSAVLLGMVPFLLGDALKLFVVYRGANRFIET
jgi:biotin transport system substrate-specific component